MGTKNNPGAFDCYANADADEPMFVLLGRDPDAGLLVRIWALLRHRRDPDGDAAKIVEALASAEALDAWTRGLGKRPTARDASFSGEHLSEQIFHLLTDGLDEHPEDWGEACGCDLCLASGAEGEEPAP